MGGRNGLGQRGEVVLNARRARLAVVRQRQQVRFGIGQGQLDAPQLRHGLVVVDINVGFGGLDRDAAVGDVPLRGGQGFPSVGKVGQDEHEADSELLCGGG